MAGLEAVLRISAQDDTSKVLAGIKEKILGIEKTAEQMEKFTSAVGRVTRSTDPLASSLLSTERALASQRNELAGVVAALDRVIGPTDKAAAAQRNLARSVETATNAISRQASAARVAGGGHAGSGGRGHGGGVLGGALPLLGLPGGAHAAARAIESGGSLAEELARLKAGGASQADIDRAQGDFRNLSRRYSGMSESDYLGGLKDALTIAPKEPHEMAALGARYRLALRNSGISSTDEDVTNVMRAMDEFGLKTPEEREQWLGGVLKAQQRFGGQINTGTLLSAVQNAKGSIYGWSPEFRDKYFPTLLQSAGEQGGTQIMTAWSNYIGGHMSHAELQSLAENGFVSNKDLMYNKQGSIVGLKKGAQPFEEDTFKSNIFQWAWDMHDEYMKRNGSTEKGFEDLVAKDPRNMGALISFAVHNRDRIKRDAGGLDLPIGWGAAEDSFLGQNPVAGLQALTTSLEQFGAVVTGPSMATIGEGLRQVAHGIQEMSAALEDWSKKHPQAAQAASGGAIAAAAAGLGWLGVKAYGAVAGFFGGGGEAAAGAASGVGGWLGGLLGGAAAPGAAGALAIASLYEWLKNFHDPGVTDEMLEKSRRSGMVAHPGGFVYDPEAHHGAALSALLQGGHTQSPAPPQQVEVHGEAKSTVTVVVQAGSSLLSIADKMQNVQQTIPLNPVQGGHSGTMDSDAAPMQQFMPWR